MGRMSPILNVRKTVFRHQLFLLAGHSGVWAAAKRQPRAALQSDTSIQWVLEVPEPNPRLTGASTQ